ncbi:MAG: hypothetical protein LBT10_07550 [Methanobrevibacter sp.]|jgi:hypothetical protein|nr:hypothetical protein [Methanobrevibacter sp.]
MKKIAGKELKYIYVNPAPKCEYCGCALSKKNLEKQNLNKNHLVHVTTYVCDYCKKLKKTHCTVLDLFIDKYNTYTKDVKRLAIQ